MYSIIVHYPQYTRMYQVINCVSSRLSKALYLSIKLEIRLPSK